MNTTLTKTKRMVIALGVGAITIGVSAFTGASKRAAGDEYGNTTAGNYVKLTNPYNSTLCQNTATTICGYRVTTAGASHVTAGFTSSQAADYVDEGWIQAIESKNGLYTGN